MTGSHAAKSVMPLTMRRAAQKVIGSRGLKPKSWSLMYFVLAKVAVLDVALAVLCPFWKKMR